MNARHFRRCPTRCLGWILICVLGLACTTPGGSHLVATPHSADKPTGATVLEIDFENFRTVDWGIGPSISFPTATDNQLGSGKWSAGPAAGFFYMRKPWVFVIQGRQLWSFAGDSDRPDVNQMVIQPIIMYGLGNNWALVTDMVIVANWEADSKNHWTVPLGGGLAKFLTIGNQPLMARLDA